MASGAVEASSATAESVGKRRSGVERRACGGGTRAGGGTREASAAAESVEASAARAACGARQYVGSTCRAAARGGRRCTDGAGAEDVLSSAGDRRSARAAYPYPYRGDRGCDARHEEAKNTLTQLMAFFNGRFIFVSDYVRM